MQQTQPIVSSTVQFILQAFYEKLKESKLLQNINQFNSQIMEMMTFQMIISSLMPMPIHTKAKQCAPPAQIQLELSANFHVSSLSLQLSPQSSQMNQLVQDDAQQQKQRTKRTSKQKDIKQAKPDLGVFALSESLVLAQQREMQAEIEQIKKKLYFNRRLRRENQQQQKRRLEQMKNRAVPVKPKRDYAYDYNGSFLFRKSAINRNNAVLMSARSQQSLQQKIIKPKIGEQQDERDYLISRGQGQTRQAKRKLFGNAGKRQASHLPFIKLCQNNKLSQNNRVMCSDPSRYTLKSVQSRGQKTFRSFAQIQKQRTQRLYSLKRSSNVSQMSSQDNQGLLMHTEIHHPHSKRMQKYLKKVCEDRSQDLLFGLNKSSNFDLLNSTHDYPVHRYYRHNYDEDKTNICDHSLVSLRLNRSRGNYTQATAI